ncbi:MAG: hypothetical protein Q8M15_07150 [Bacteroidota bacterium]|nr:hypothetical protein [Bacteroidota bacterium]
MERKIYLNKEILIAEYLQGSTSYRKLGKKYKICSRTINTWVLNYKGKTKKQIVNLSDQDLAPLPSDVKQLQAELRKAQLKNKLLETIIDTAEEDLGIDIRKKSGAKQ